jgi:WD40 repeat protein
MNIRQSTLVLFAAITGLVFSPAGAATLPLERPKNHGGFFSFAFSPDGTLVAGGTGAITSEFNGRKEVAGGEVILWDAKTGKMRRTLGTHGATVNWVAFSGNGAVLASASTENGVVKLWDGKTGAVRHTLELPGELGSTSNGAGRLCALSGDGKSIATVAVKLSEMGKLRVRTGDELTVWETATGRRRWQLPESNVHALAFSADGATLSAFAMKVDWKPSADGSSASGEHTARRFVAWDAGSGKPHFDADAGNSSPEALAFVPELGLVALDARKLLVIDPATGVSGKEIELETKSNLRSIDFSLDGTRFAAVKFMGDGIEFGVTATGKTAGVQEFTRDRFSNVSFSTDFKRAAGVLKFDPVVLDLAPAADPGGR